MRYLLLLLLTILSCLNTKSQNLSYYSGAAIENFEKSYFELFQQDAEKIYAFHYTKPGYYLDIFDKSNLLREAHIPIPLPPRDSIKFDFENLFILKDRFLVFYSYFNKAEQTAKLEMIAFDKAGARTGAIKLIDELPGITERKAGTFVVSDLSRDEQFLSYGYKKEKDKYYLNIDHFDYSGNKLKSQDFIIDNSRYLVASFLNDETICRFEQDSRNENHANRFLSFYSPSSGKPEIINVNPPEGSGVHLTGKFGSYTDENGILYLLCPYTTSLLASKARGVYLVTADLKKHRVIRKVTIPFKTEATDDADGADFSLKSCILTNIIPLKSGMRVLFESRLLLTTYGAPTSYNLGNIISVDIDTNSLVTAINLVHKKQVTNPARVKYMGFTTLTHNDITYCIYNELPGNLERSDSKLKNTRGANADETIVIAAALTPGGVEKSRVIDRSGQSDIDAILPRKVLKDSFKKGIIYVLRQKDKDVLLTKIVKE
ncbi:hypothetical protein A8C56_08250 [Niabella ginsenosidivorans]|uniref:Uncharacterized protein n=1 Tax=Niabella ginsenosidivorans TaxID=1176587 RepID=A0A1A9I0E7_9BACT|nr:hypothetical protein [Niabella ginsenosidivorans]ANH80973.1 hypothetical protein A8C56_08250 [Niabella ginsenosidivorans]